MDEKSKSSSKIKALEILLEKYKRDSEKLIAENKRLKKYRQQFIGDLLIFLSAVIFSISVFFFIAEIQLILIALFAFAISCLAIYLVFVYSPREYHLNLTNATLKIAYNNLVQALSSFHLESYSIFLFKEDKVLQYIPFQSLSDSIKLPTSKELIPSNFKIQNKGILLEPFGNGILKLIEEIMSIERLKLNNTNIEPLLQEIFVEKLNLARDLNFSILEKKQYKLILTENYFNYLDIMKKPMIKGFVPIGCPISSCVAILLAHITKRSIILRSYHINQKENISTIILELGELYS